MSKLTMARFERLRRNAGSVTQIAERIDYDSTLLSMWECGQRRRKLPAGVIRDLAQLLGVKPEELATEDGKAIFIEPTARLIP